MKIILRVVGFIIAAFCLLLIFLAYFVVGEANGIRTDGFGRQLYEMPFFYKMAGINESTGILWSIVDWIVFWSLAGLSVTCFNYSSNNEND
jgi:hypothetical protein